MRKYFLFLFGVIFLAEGSGLIGNRQLLAIMYISWCSVAYLLLRKNSEPRSLPITFLFFFGFISIISLFNSVNFANSLWTSLFYISFIPLYLLTNSVKMEEKWIRYGLVGMGIILIIYSFILYGSNKFWSLLIPTTGYQLVYSVFNAHNHLGDYLSVSSMIISAALLKQITLKRFILWVVFALGIFLSYSRSAYVGFISGLILQLIWLSKYSNVKLKAFFAVTIGICLVFFFTVSNILSTFPIITELNYFTQKQFDWRSKEIISSRDQYYTQAIKGLINNPLWGVGPNNFMYISAKDSPHSFTNTSHNIFLEFFSENGLLAGCFFLFFSVITLKNALLKKDLISIIWLVMVIIALFDYVYRIYGFMYLFISFSALINSPRTVK